MERVITVKGSGSVKVKPDLIIINMELESHKYDYDDTMKVATETTDKLEKAIESIGIDKKELKTTKFNINSSYKGYYDENNNYKSKFDGYVCEQGLRLQFDLNMDLLSKVLNAIAKSDVKPKLDIKFSVKDKEAVNEELLISATNNGRKKAEILAKASRVSLGKLLSIDYNWGELSIYSQTRYAVESESLIMEQSYAPSIEPEDISLTDTVTFVWEIK